MLAGYVHNRKPGSAGTGAVVVEAAMRCVERTLHETALAWHGPSQLHNATPCSVCYGADVAFLQRHCVSHRVGSHFSHAVLGCLLSAC